MDKTYITLPVAELSNIDYDQLITSNSESATRNAAKDTAIVKWRGDMPNTIVNITNKGEILTYEQVCELLNTSAWAQEAE